jgi:hypothetical protein
LPFGFPLLLGRAAVSAVLGHVSDPVFVEDFREGVGAHGIDLTTAVGREQGANIGRGFSPDFPRIETSCFASVRPHLPNRCASRKSESAGK